jgi:hypothetical protein
MAARVKALVVGGSNRKNKENLAPKLARWGIDMEWSWPSDNGNGIAHHSAIPAACDLVVILKDCLGHATEKTVRGLVQKSKACLVVLPFKSSKWATIFSRYNYGFTYSAVPKPKKARVAKPVAVKTECEYYNKTPVKLGLCDEHYQTNYVGRPYCDDHRQSGPSPDPLCGCAEVDKLVATVPVEVKPIVVPIKKRTYTRYGKVLTEVTGPGRAYFVDAVWRVLDNGPMSTSALVSGMLREQDKRLFANVSQPMQPSTMDKLLHDVVVLGMLRSCIRIEKIHDRLTKFERDHGAAPQVPYVPDAVEIDLKEIEKELEGCDLQIVPVEPDWVAKLTTMESDLDAMLELVTGQVESIKSAINAVRVAIRK